MRPPRADVGRVFRPGMSGILALATGLALSGALLAADRDTRVADAAMRGDVQAVRALITQQVDVNVAQGDGMTALHWAARMGDAELTRLLLAGKANVKATTRLGDITPMYLAAESGEAAVINLLLTAGGDANVATALGVTPTMVAASGGHTAVIKALAKGGADVNAKENTYGQTPLMFAAANNHAATIDALIDLGADLSIATRVRAPGGRGGGGGAGRGGGRGGGGNAAAGGTAAGRGAGAPGQTAGGGGRGAARGGAAGPPAATGAAGTASAAGVAGQAPPAEPQGAEQARPAAEPMGGLTPLHYAARQGQTDAVRVLLERKANINVVTGDQTSPLMLAIINGHFDLAMSLLERGADPKMATAAGGTPLYRVIDLQWAPKSFYPQPDIRQQRVSHLELMKALMAKGANPNARLAKALWYTTYGFDLDALDPTGATPFWRASQAGDVAAMRLLVAPGADPKVGTNDGVTPLLALAGDGFHGNDAIVVPAGRMPATRYLVDELKADVNAVDERGGAATSILHQNTRAYTSVHAAAARGDNEMIEYLVSKGARVDLVGRNGLTAADMANGPRERIQPFPETIKLLIKLGSKFSNRCQSC